ncbi:hypothetical protein P7K49_040212 [Saguinus oedipus]|uniref:Uncharacterized protein n=1 Tax=Saguinus oedipus TaxID=9490 RepID=A0ABQ9TA75_SAGOE|nr:hypothetical protein P7K49_040212 [Saguinus oedipus]
MRSTGWSRLWGYKRLLPPQVPPQRLPRDGDSSCHPRDGCRLEEAGPALGSGSRPGLHRAYRYVLSPGPSTSPRWCGAEWASGSSIFALGSGRLPVPWTAPSSMASAVVPATNKQFPPCGVGKGPLGFRDIEAGSPPEVGKRELRSQASPPRLDFCIPPQQAAAPEDLVRVGH